MEQGFKAVAEAVETEQPESLQETFFVSAVAINSAAPSTLGTILSVAMQSFSNDCTGLTDIDQARFAEMLHHASDQMTGMGGAKRGDKTILDSLCPYAEYLTEHEGPGIWRDAAEKAEEAAQATACSAYRARKNVWRKRKGSVRRRSRIICCNRGSSC